MGNWVSKNGLQVPAKEKVALTDKNGEPYIYEGPDRSATEYLKDQGVTHLGRNFWEDPELIGRVRQIHNCTMKEYMEMMGYDEKTSLAEVEKKLEEVVTHQAPKRGRPRKDRSGGTNTAANGGHYEGGFGDLNDAKATVK
jgi:hypothetical protein